MTEQTFEVALAGRRWQLPHLPFRAIMAIQPALMQVYAELGGADMTSGSVAALGEAQLQRLAEAAYCAVHHVEPDLSREAFFDLPFSVNDLIQAFPAIAKAAGLRAATQAETRQEAPGKSISTD